MQTKEQVQREITRLTESKPSILVTATPPTPNGDLHVGHLSGPYLRADVYTRFVRLRGGNAKYLTGIDDHQSYVAMKAERMRSTPDATADRFADKMLSTLAGGDIHVDWVGFPRGRGSHIQEVLRMIRSLHERGALISKLSPATFCPKCQEFVFEAYVSGKCPHCGSSSGGNACEVCGRPNDCADLVDAICKRCDTSVELRSYERLYFPLSTFASKLTAYWNGVHMNAHMRALCLQMAADGLPDIAVTHLANWGIPAPVPGFEQQRIYVWAEMAAGYLAAARDLRESRSQEERLPDYWRDPGSEVVQFFGFDNGYFHAVLFPALFFAYDESIRPPTAFITNEFYRLEGSKFSTSRNHAIWGEQILGAVPADLVRFYLSYNGPEFEQTNFAYAAMVEFVDRELHTNWRRWLLDLGRKVHERFQGNCPGPGTWTSDHVHFYGRILRTAEEVALSYSTTAFSTQNVTRALCDLVSAARRSATLDAHIAGVPGRADALRTGTVLELTAARLLALAVAPIMPRFAKWLWDEIGFEKLSMLGAWSTAIEFPPEGQRVGSLACELLGPLPKELAIRPNGG